MKILKKGKYYGAKKKELDIGGILLSDYDYVEKKTDWHYHENPYFMFLLDGQVWDVNKSEKRSCCTGTLLFHNWDGQHFNEKHSKDARGFHIEFERSWLSKFDLSHDVLQGSCVLIHPNAHIALSKIYFEFLTNDKYSSIGIESELIDLCKYPFTHETYEYKNCPDWVHALVEMIHYTDDDLNLNSLSKTLNLHPVYLSRSAKKYLGFSLSEYMRMIKVKKALHSVYKADESLTEIGYSSGFYDQSHFGSVFKSYLGSTPKYFQKSVSSST